MRAFDIKNEVEDNHGRSTQKKGVLFLIKRKITRLDSFNLLYSKLVRFRKKKYSEKEVQMLINKKSILSGFFCEGKYELKNGKLVRTDNNENFLLEFGKSNNKYVEADIFFGGWTNKIILLFDDIVLSIYPDEHKGWVNNINSFIREFNYPIPVFKEINLKQQYTICSKIKGNQSYNRKRYITVLKDILKNNIKAKKYYNIQFEKENINQKLEKNNINNVISYIQHGDAAICNVLWHGSEYRYIDCDLINYYPALYDFFSFLTFDGMGSIGYKYVVNGFFNSLIVALFELKEEEVIAIIDKYLAAFFIFLPGRLNADINILKRMIPKSYSITWGLINNAL